MMEANDYYGTAMTKPGSSGEMPLPRRTGPKAMVPLSWIGRAVKLDYANGHGSDVSTAKGTLLDWCVLGLVISLNGTKTLISFDRLVLLELVND